MGLVHSKQTSNNSKKKKKKLKAKPKVDRQSDTLEQGAFFSEFGFSSRASTFRVEVDKDWANDFGYAVETIRSSAWNIIS